MSALIVVAAIVILAGVVVVAMGRGGELARDQPESPAPGDFSTWYEVAAYRPPTALLGYHATATERALSEIARTIADRDAEIDRLRRRLAAAELPADPEWQRVPDQAGQGPALLDPADRRQAE